IWDRLGNPVVQKQTRLDDPVDCCVSVQRAAGAGCPDALSDESGRIPQTFVKGMPDSEMIEPKKLSIDERVLWGDVDAARIIFYGSYLRFFEIAETELFRAVGMPYGKVFDELDIWLPRVHLECDFHRAAQLDDLLEVSVYVGNIGRTSLQLNFEVRRKRDSGEIEPDLIATAHFVLVSTDRKNLKPLPVPDELRRALTPYASSHLSG